MAISTGRGRLALLGVALASVAGTALDLSVRRPTERGVTLLLVLVGLLAGAVLGGAIPRGRRARTAVERVNDGAFAVVVGVVWLVAVFHAGRWSGLVTGVIAGLALRATLRRAAVTGP